MVAGSNWLYLQLQELNQELQVIQYLVYCVQLQVHTHLNARSEEAVAAVSHIFFALVFPFFIESLQ